MTYDAAIVGAGPAGAVAAFVLSGRGRRVILVDPAIAEISERKIGESLPGAARPLLRRLGLLSLVEEGPHLPSHGNVFAWGSDALDTTDFIRDPNGLGWHLDRIRFDRDLRQAAVRAGTILSAKKVGDLKREGNIWKLEHGKKSIQARWLIDATGRGAGIARKLGAVRIQDDSLMAAYAWVQVDEEISDRRTLIESVPEGWWYTSGLPDGTHVVALHSTTSVLRPLMKDKRAWKAALRRTQHIGPRFTKAHFLSELRCTQAGGAHLDRSIGPGWLATGDAALSFDPLSSQGIFNAIYTGMKAAQAIDATMSGEGRAMEAYQARLDAIGDAYRANRRHVYSTETRFREAPFWKFITGRDLTTFETLTPNNLATPRALRFSSPDKRSVQ